MKGKYSVAYLDESYTKAKLCKVHKYHPNGREEIMKFETIEEAEQCIKSKPRPSREYKIMLGWEVVKVVRV